MRILAVDTAEKACSVALAEADRVLVELRTAGAGTHARRLMPLVESALSLGGMTPEDVDGFAVCRGPGSFTGVRIGMSCILGMAQALDRPVVGVSSLEALARQGAVSRHLVCSMMDARRSEVYWALFDQHAGALAVVKAERAGAPDDAIDAVDRDCLFIGSGALVYRDRIVSRLGRKARFAADGQHAISAAAVARCAHGRLADGGGGETVSPVYLRDSDARRNTGPRPGSD